MTEQPQTEAFRKLDEILVGLDPYTQRFADQLREAMRLMPMSHVLDKVPGETTGEKVKAMRITRATWYSWNRGEVRPNKRQARRLAHLTGIAAENFRGRR